MPDEERWTRVVVQVPAERAELAADVLWRFGPAAIEEQERGGDTVLAAGFARPAAARAALDALDGSGHGPAALVPVVDDGLDAWRAFARPQAAPPFVVVPTWLSDPAPDPDLVALRIDPGRTFGSGSHPTSRLVLGRLGDLTTAGTVVLDVGCGSGILSVAAALLGARSVTAIDVDPEAIPATTANAVANGVGELVRATADPLAEVTRSGARFDLVVANLLAPIVVELAAELRAAVASGGSLVVSGLLADRWRLATDAIPGAAVVDVTTLDGWAAVTLEPTG